MKTTCRSSGIDNAFDCNITAHEAPGPANAYAVTFRGNTMHVVDPPRSEVRQWSASGTLPTSSMSTEAEAAGRGGQSTGPEAHGQKALTESSTCSEWKEESQAEQFAFVKRFVADQGEEAAAGILVVGWIVGKCAEGSTSEIGVLAAEAQSKH
jgi:hypothetical protein